MTDPAPGARRPPHLPLSQAIAVSRAGPDGWTAEVSPDWAQGRAAFGGIVSGLAVNVLEQLRPEDRLPRSLMIQFISPLSPGPLRIDATILRAGASLTHTRLTLVQGASSAAVVLATLGRARATALTVAPPVMPPRPPPADLPAFPYLDGVTPRFSAGFDYRWTCTTLPFSGTAPPTLSGWIRPRDPAPVTLAGLTALIDAWPAPVLSLATSPVPASTVSWTIDLIDDGPAAGWPAGTWFHFDADTIAAADGYATITGRLHHESGHLVAVSRQLVVEYSR